QNALGWQKGGVYYLLCLFIPVVLLPVLLTVLPIHKKRSGVILIHLGILLLLVGEGMTSRLQKENLVILDEGDTANFVQDTRNPELAIIDSSPADYNEETVIPAARLADGTAIH